MNTETVGKPAAQREPGLNTSVIRISWPASVEFLVITSVVFADILFLARLGTEIIAGVGISVTVFRVFFEGFNSVAVASTTVVAQAVGARNSELARRGAGQSLLLAIVLGFISGGVGVLIASWAMALMGADGLVRESGRVYMQINMLASPFYAVSLAGGGALKGVGDTRTPMMYTFVSSAFKIVLSAALIFGRWGFPALGVKGAALATLFGYGLNALLITAKLARGFDGIRVRLNALLPDWGLLRRIVVLAWPVAAERMVMRTGFVFYMRVVSALGTVALAANQIALRLESVSLTIGFGFTIAATTLVGQAVGRRDLEGAAARAWATMRLSASTMAAMTVILILVRHLAVGMFKPDPDVRQLAVACLVIGAFELPAFSVLFTFAGALRGAGDTRSPMIVALIGTFAFRLPLVYLLGIRFGLGLKGIWYGTLLDWIGRAVLMYFIFRTGKWKARAFIQEDEARGGLP
jgi:putative MATE family efflux protein